MEETNKWLDLVRNLVPAEETGPLLIEGAARLKSFLKSDAQAGQCVLDILNKHLGGTINTETWDIVNSSLINYLGQDLTYLLYWVVQVDNAAANRLQEIEKYASPEVMAFLRSVVCLYDYDLSKAFDYWARLPDAWSGCYRDIYYDQINNRYYLRIRIEKYNGEKVVIEGNADTILELTNFFIRTLYMVGKPEAFTPTNMQQLSQEITELVKVLYPEEKKKPARKKAKRARSKV